MLMRLLLGLLLLTGPANAAWMRHGGGSSTTPPPPVVTACAGTTGPGVSPDGSCLSAQVGLSGGPDGTGHLVTSDGTWTFGNTLVAGANFAGYAVKLNNVVVGGSNTAAMAMSVANGGKLYVLLSGQWYLWNGAFSGVSGPILTGLNQRQYNGTAFNENSTLNYIGGPLPNPMTATFTGSITSDTLTASGVSGTIGVGQEIVGTSFGSFVPPVTRIVSQLTGTTGKDGTYRVSLAQNTSSRGMATTPLWTVTIQTVPTAGRLYLFDGVTQVNAGASLSLGQVETLRYTPDPNTGGRDLFYFAVSDQGGITLPAVFLLYTSPIGATTTNAGILVDQAASATAMSIPAPTHSLGLAMTVHAISLPTTGTVTLADGTTPVDLTTAYTTSQLTGMKFKPTTTATNGQTGGSTFFYGVSDPGGGYGIGKAVLVINTGGGSNVATTNGTLSVLGDASATAMSITAPTGSGTLTSTVTGLPSNGTVTLSGGGAVNINDTLTNAALTGLKFTPAAGVYNKRSSFTWTTSNGTGAANGSQELNVGGNTVLVWADPPSGFTPAAGIDQYPSVVQPAAPGDIVGVRFQNTSGSTEAAGYVTWGQVFLDGQVQPGDTLVAVYSAAKHYLQMDVKATWADGSVKHAILTTLVPSIAGNGTQDELIQKCTSGCPSAPTPTYANVAAVIASAYDVNTTYSGGFSDASSCKSILSAANTAGTIRTWLNGPAVKEYDAIGTVDGDKLKIECDIRVYADGTFATDLIVDNSWMYCKGGAGCPAAYNSNAKTNLNYNILVAQDSYAISSIPQVLYTTWDHWVYGTGIIHPNVQYDVPYLMATGATLLYDTSYGVLDSSIQHNNSILVPNGTGILGTGPMGTGIVTTDMGAQSGRQDIAPQPNWTAQWQMSQNATAHANMIANANASGGIPWHYSDETLDAPFGAAINGITHANFWINVTGTGYLTPTNGWPDGTSPWGVPWSQSAAHSPDLNYMAYLTTGNHYQLELMEHLANFCITIVGRFSSDTPSLYESSGTKLWGYANVAGNQPRALAWETRSIAEAAFIVPDSDVTKSYFVAALQEGLTALVQEYVVNNINQRFGQLNGTLGGSHGDSGDVVWETGFIEMGFAQAQRANIPIVSGLAKQMLDFMAPVAAGWFLNGPAGFDPLAAAGYGVGLLNFTSDLAKPEIGINVYCCAPITTWAGIYNANIWPWWQAGDGGTQGPIGGPSTLTLLPNVAPGYGGFATIARGALAEVVSNTQNPLALQALGFVEGQVIAGYGPPGYAVAAFQEFPQFNFMPQMPDGTWLTANARATFDQTGSGGTISAGSGDWLIAKQGAGTMTLNGESVGSSDIIVGDSGTTAINAGTASLYAVGGCGATTFTANSGSNDFNGGATCYAPSAAKSYVYGTAYTGAQTIRGFRHGTDNITFKSNLNGSGITTAAGFIAAGTTSGSNCVFATGGASTITVVGTICSGLSAADVTIN